MRMGKMMMWLTCKRSVFGTNPYSIGTPLYGYYDGLGLNHMNGGTQTFWIVYGGVLFWALGRGPWYSVHTEM